MSRPKPQSPRTIPLPEPDEPDLDQAVQMALEMETQQRLWLRTLLPFIYDQRQVSQNEATEMARDLLVMTAVERARRIMQSDLRPARRKRERSEHHRARM